MFLHVAICVIIVIIITCIFIIVIHYIFNPFVPNAPFLYPLKTSENLTVFGCFQGVEKRCIGKECVNILLLLKTDYF